MQLFYILLLLNSLLKATVGSDPQNGNDKVIKNKGRLSRVTWLLHENENDNLDRRMFDDDEKTREKTNNKMHYKKRKYNVKVQHNRKESMFRNTSKKASISKRKEIVKPKYVHMSKNNKRPTSKVEPKEVISKVNKNRINTVKLNKAVTELKPVLNIKDRSSIYSRNYIESDNILKDLRKDLNEKNKKAAKDNLMVLKKVPRRYGKNENELTSKSQVHRKPKTVYLKKVENPNSLIREEARTLHSKMDPNRNIRNDFMNAKTRENILKLIGLNFASLANPPKQMKVKIPKVHDDDNSYIADELAKKVRVLCWVMTHPSNHNRTCKPIKDTWGKRCNKLLFMSSEYDPDIPTVKLDVREGRGFLWPKVKAAFKYVYDNYFDQYDWFVRADDDTFLVVENLRYLLAGFNPKEPMYFGCRFKHFTPQGFMSGGASIPLSKAALKRLVAVFDSEICKASIDDDLGTDDVNLGMCLSRVGVKAMDSRDVAHKGRFLVFMPQDHVSPTKLASAKSFWYWKYVYYPTEIGEGCCSDYAVSFHYVTPDDMYALEYLIYRVRPFGIHHGDGPVPKILGKAVLQPAFNRRSRTKDEITTKVTDPTTTTQVNEDSTKYTQYTETESDVTTKAEHYDKTESSTTEVLITKTTHSQFYEQYEVSDAVPTEKDTSLKNEEHLKRSLKHDSTNAPAVNITEKSTAGINITNTTVSNKILNKVVVADTKKVSLVEKQATKRTHSKISKIQRSIKQVADIKHT